MLTMQDLLDDRTGRRYRDVIEAEPKAVEAVVDLLGRADLQAAMEKFEAYGRPALYGAVRDVEALPAVVELRNSGRRTERFRQLVGVIARLAMESRGFETTGRAGSLRSVSDWFMSAERYERSGQPHDNEDAVTRLRRGRAELEQIGDEDERRETVALLMTSLAASREEDGRPF